MIGTHCGQPLRTRHRTVTAVYKHCYVCHKTFIQHLRQTNKVRDGHRRVFLIALEARVRQLATAGG